MNFRTDLATRVVEAGRPYTVFIVDNPIIDDVVVVEMKLRAAEIMNNEVKADYRVARDIRDVLIRLGVER
jgi:hypothetical protein